MTHGFLRSATAESSNRQSSMAFSLRQLLVAYSSFDGSIPDKKLECIIKGAWYPVMSHCILRSASAQYINRLNLGVTIIYASSLI